MPDTMARLRRTVVAALRLDCDPADVPVSDLRNALGIDSLSGLELLIWVENEFDIQIDDEDLTVALVDSLETLAQYVDARIAAGAAVKA
ncbi:MAG: acyl carrier protein [Frankiaceae bacterium]